MAGSAVGAVNSAEPPPPSSLAAAVKIATNATTQAGAVQSNATAKIFDSTSTVSSVSELQQKAPQLWQEMMQGIATTICNNMQDDQAQLKELWDQMTDDNSAGS